MFPKLQTSGIYLVYTITNMLWLNLLLLKVKVKWSRYRPGVAQRVGRGIALLFHDHSTRRGWVVSSMPRPHFTPGKDPLPILQETGWAPGQVGLAENFVPTRIRSWTVQPVVSRYNDWATRPTIYYYYKHKNHNNAIEKYMLVLNPSP